MPDFARLDVPGLLRQHKLKPNKRLGQNFLIDETALQRIVEAAEIQPGDDVLEIGPGLGSLTRWLARQARRVTAVELDAGLLPPMRQALADTDNVCIELGDILALDPASLMPEPGYLVVANIPYYITSAVIRHLLEARSRPSRLVLTVQREVAARICAAPGDLSLLALGVQVYGQPKVVAHIPAGAFYPPPEVDSAVVRVDLYAAPCVPAERRPLFFRLTKAGFSQKRKTLRNALSGGMGWPPAQGEALLRQAGIDPQRRAETVSLSEWDHLATVVQQAGAI